MTQQEEIIQLRQQIADAEAQNALLKQQLRELQTLQAPRPIDGYYTLEQFLAALQRRLGRTYGWRKDYVFASQTTPGATPVETETIQQWQARGLVPQVYLDQIDMLRFPKRTRPEFVD